VSRRYEQKSIVLTTNLAFKEWDTIFPKVVYFLSDVLV